MDDFMKYYNKRNNDQWQTTWQTNTIDLTFARLAQEKNNQREAEARERNDRKQKRISLVLALRIMLCIPMAFFSINKIWQYVKSPYETLEALAVIWCLIVIAWTIDDWIKFRETRPDKKGKSIE